MAGRIPQFLLDKPGPQSYTKGGGKIRTSFIEKGITVGVSPRSALLDSTVPLNERLYGYHRLDNPQVALPKDDEWFVCDYSEMDGMIDRGGTTIQKENRTPEPYKG